MKLNAFDYSINYNVFRINFIYRSLRPIAINATKLNYSVLSGKNQWHHYGNSRYRQILDNQLQLREVGRRNYGMLIGRVLRGALKLRYLVLGTAVGGSVTLNKVKISNLFLSIKSL